MKMLRLVFVLLAVSVASAAFAQSQCLLTYQTETLAPFHVNQVGSFDIIGVSGTEPYRFEIVEGTLPEGLHLNNNGKLHGKPREETETVIFVLLTDAAGCSITQAFPLSVFP